MTHSLVDGAPLLVEDLDLSGIGFYLTKDPNVPDDDYEFTNYTSLGRSLWQRKSDLGKKRFEFEDKEIKLHKELIK